MGAKFEIKRMRKQVSDAIKVATLKAQGTLSAGDEKMEHDQVRLEEDTPDGRERCLGATLRRLTLADLQLLQDRLESNSGSQGTITRRKRKSSSNQLIRGTPVRPPIRPDGSKLVPSLFVPSRKWSGKSNPDKERQFL